MKQKLRGASKAIILVLMQLPILAMAADTYVYLTKDGVNLREEPSTTAAIVEKGKKGTVFVVEETKTGWYKGKNAQYGDVPVWISTSVSQKGMVGDVQMPAWSIVSMPEAAFSYENVKKSSGGEVYENWTFTSSNPNFWMDEKPGSKFDAVQNISVINANGSVRAYETQYKGSAYAYYLKITEESKDGGSSFDKLESPIYVYPSIGSESGIYVDGNFFRDSSGMDDEW